MPIQPDAQGGRARLHPPKSARLQVREYRLSQRPACCLLLSEIIRDAITRSVWYERLVCKAAEGPSSVTSAESNKSPTGKESRQRGQNPAVRLASLTVTGK